MTARATARGWHREDIKAELRKRHGNLTDLSLAWGFNRAAISAAIVSPRRYRAVCRRIAEALGTAPHTLWPDVWTPEGHLTPRTESSAHASRVPSGAHRQKRIAA